MTGIIFLTDPRLTYLADRLEQSGHRIERIRDRKDYEHLIEEGQISGRAVIVLPIGGTTDGTIKLNEETLDLTALFTLTGTEMILISGVDTPYQRAHSDHFYCFQKDEQIGSKNAEYTAEGVLWMLLGKTAKGLREYRYDVVGGGKTGSEICRLLSDLGLEFRLISTSGRSGSVSTEEWLKTEPADIVINTSPVPVVTADQCSNWSRPIILVDISSRGKGIDPDMEKVLPITRLQAPSLPGVVAPESAGELLAEFVENCLREVSFA